jgi:hypothetical protein
LVVDMVVVEILMMLVKEDLLVEEGNKIVVNLAQLLHLIQHKEMLVVDKHLALLIEVVVEVVQVVQVNLVLMLLAVMPLVVRDLLFLSLLHH